MTIGINNVASINEIGGRSNNEDFVLPLPHDCDSWMHSTFIVCDGVGGNAKGEVASKLVAESLLSSIDGIAAEFISSSDIQLAVAAANEAIDSHIAENSSAEGMATTVAMVVFHKQGATIAHIGDSRVYHIRDGHILFCTTDHSWVNEMIRSGVLTPEEAIDHPRKNVITRAVQGKNKPSEPTVSLICDIQKGDYFFICSDGVLESVSEHVLAGLCAAGNSLKTIMTQIKNICQGNSRDNFTCCLVEVGEVSGGTDEKYASLPYVIRYDAVAVQVDSPYQPSKSSDVEAVRSSDSGGSHGAVKNVQEPIGQPIQRSSRPPARWITIALLTSGLLFLGVMASNYLSNRKAKVAKRETPDLKQGQKKHNRQSTLYPITESNETSKEVPIIKERESELNSNLSSGSSTSSTAVTKTSAKAKIERTAKSDGVKPSISTQTISDNSSGTTVTPGGATGASAPETGATIAVPEVTEQNE